MKMLPVVGILRERTNTGIRWLNREKHRADGTDIMKGLAFPARAFLVCLHRLFGVFSMIQDICAIFSFGAGWIEEKQERFSEYGGYRPLKSAWS
jgi:hypothetical protein